MSCPRYSIAGYRNEKTIDPSLHKGITNKLVSHIAVVIFYESFDGPTNPNLKCASLDPDGLTKPCSLSTELHTINSISAPQGDLVSCRGLVEAHQLDVEELKDQLEKGMGQEVELQEELVGLRTEITRLGSSEDTLQSKLSGRDRRISHLEEKMADMQEARVRRLDAVGGTVLYCSTVYCY